MLIPYGEYILFAVTAAGWSEKWPCRRWLYAMSLAWVGGKILEWVWVADGIWHWNFGRLAVVAVFYLWAWPQAQKRVIPLLLAVFVMAIEELFVLNVPGTLPGEAWWFGAALILVTYLTAQNYWAMAAALAGALLMDQLIVRYLGTGVLNYGVLPGEFSWHFGVIVCTVGAMLRRAKIDVIQRVITRERKKRRQNDGTQPAK